MHVDTCKCGQSNMPDTIQLKNAIKGMMEENERNKALAVAPAFKREKDRERGDRVNGTRRPSRFATRHL